MPTNNPLLVQYAREPWMMEPSAARLFLAALGNVAGGELLSAVRVETPLPMRVEGDKAVIPISGVLLKSVPSDLKVVFGSRVTGYDDIRRMVQTAVADPAVSQIELRITSPGGMVAGGMETAEAIRTADAVKPVTAVIEDLGASGAFWLALSARRIEANANAEVGSIGVYTYYVDWSGFEERMGIKIIVIRTGEHKAMGLDKITDSQIAAMQEVIDGMNAHFIDQVAAGRRVSREAAAAWATGRLWLAPAAMAMGLIDAITNSQGNSTSSIKEQTMAEQAKEQAPADTGAISKAAAQEAVNVERKRAADLRAAFPNDPAFAMEAIQSGWDVKEAKAERHDRLEKEAAETPKGERPIRDHDSEGGGGVDFIAQARQIAREQKISMTEAMRQVQSEDPESYHRFRAKEQSRPVRTRSGKGGGRVTV